MDIKKSTIKKPTIKIGVMTGRKMPTLISGYIVQHGVDDEFNVEYENSAKKLDDCWLLEETKDSKSGEIISFGIEKNIQDTIVVQTRLYDRAVKFAEGLVTTLTPKFENEYKRPGTD